jgi:mannonate dehydratase
MAATGTEPPRRKRKLFTRRRFVALAGAGLVGAVGLRLWFPRWLRPGPPRALEGEALEFAERCFEGLNRAAMWDGHVHVIGLGNGTGCMINPELKSHLHPIKRFQYDAYTNSIGMREEETADADYVERLFALHRLANPQGKLILLGFDHFVDESGVERPEQSAFHTPNEYVMQLARDNADAVAAVSIHPYRADAVEQLERFAAEGAVAVKWLPNSMGIDPAAPRCDAFYRKLAELGLPLITHGGKEYAVEGGHGQELGNPLRLRRALDAGVRVVVSHCASFGDSLDLDAPEAERRELAAFDLFLRLMGEKQYEQSLFADISALNQVNRSGRALREMLKLPELHGRLVSGSDFPLPCIGILFSTRALRLRGYLTKDEARLCNEVHDANPLLFDFVVKRSLNIEEGGTVHRFADSVFETDWLFRRPA